MIQNQRSRRKSPPDPQEPVARDGLRTLLHDVLRALVTDRVLLLLTTSLMAMTVLAMGPLQPLDIFVNMLPRLESEPLRRFLIYWPDTIASRGVALPVLGMVTVQLALWVRSWRPIVLAVGSVFTMICLVAAMKLVIARSHPSTGDPSFFVDFGQNFSFPSGHGANSTLIYGLALYLMIRYRAVRPATALCLGYAIVAIAAVQTVVSAYLRFHWISDLVTGMIAGLLVLRVAILIDRSLPAGLLEGRWPFRARAPAPATPVVVPSVPTLPVIRGKRAPVGRYRPAPARVSTRMAMRPTPVRPMPTRPARIRPMRPPAGETPPTS